MQNLWGEFEIEKVQTPKSILEAQGDHLPKITKRKVYACVNEIEPIEDHGRDFNFKFSITSDYLTKYSYSVLSVHHSVDMYPLYIITDNSILSEIKDKFTLEGIMLGNGIGTLMGLGMSLSKVAMSSLIGSSTSNLEEEYPRDSIIIINEEQFIMVVEYILQSKKIRRVISSLVSLSDNAKF